MMRLLLLPLFLACLSPAWAEDPSALDTLPQANPTPLDATSFDARTKGLTITYFSGGAPYGEEQYLPDRRVRWVFSEGQCQYGSWSQKGNQICFAYDNQPQEQCWIFADQPEGLMAWYEGDFFETPLISKQESPMPLRCAGPDVGA